MSHQCNIYCIDGWHATVLYSTQSDPLPDHFDLYYPGCATEHELAKEAPLHPELAAGKHGAPPEWIPYLVRWKRREYAQAT